MIFYLSFAGDDGWIGCVHTEANNAMEAVLKTHVLGINPGGEVAIIELPQSVFECPEGARILHVLDRLLGREEMEALNGPMVKMPDELFS